MTDNTDNQGRRGQWFSLAAFTTIALASFVNDMSGDLADQRKEMKWSFSALVMALGFAFMSMVASLVLRERFSGTPMEHGMAVCVLAILGGGLSTIMRPGEGIATDSIGGIRNANLYFFSWASFAMALLIYVGYLKEAYGIGKRTDESGFNAASWAGLAMTSFIVMSSSTRVFNEKNCEDLDDDFCDRTKFAVALGTFSGFVALLWMALGSRLPAFIDVILSFAMLGAWCFGVGYITFGDEKAPARVLGNVYFFTWGSFAVASNLAAAGMQQLGGMLFKDSAPDAGEKNEVADDNQTPPHDEEAQDEDDQA
jgi:hypothetical protein